MIDREYGHHIQFSADWHCDDEQSEGVHTVDIYDATLSTVFDVFIKFIAGEYEFSREFVEQRFVEHVRERG